MENSRIRVGGVRRALRDSRGAIDLAAVLVGAIVLGVVSAGATVTLATVIPWSQDETSMGNLRSVSLAQAAANLDVESYLDFSDLVADGFIESSSDVASKSGLEGACFVSLARSDSGSLFVASSRQLEPDLFVPHVTPPSKTDWCIAAADLDNLVADSTGVARPARPEPEVVLPVDQWRNAVTPGNSTTTIEAVEVRVMNPGSLCLDITVGTTSPSRTLWQVNVDTNRPPFFGQNTRLWTSHSVSRSSTFSTVSGSGDAWNPWNTTWNNGLMAAGSQYTFAVCDTSRGAQPDRVEAYRATVKQSTTSWGGRVNCMTVEVAGRDVYPFYVGWTVPVDMSSAVAELEAKGFKAERISYSPMGQTGDTLTPSSWTPGTNIYVLTAGRDNGIVESSKSVVDVCVHDD